MLYQLLNENHLSKSQYRLPKNCLPLESGLKDRAERFNLIKRSVLLGFKSGQKIN